MEALIQILFNTKNNTYHPIYFLQSGFPGGADAKVNQNIVRFKSKGHHTFGFNERQAALQSIHERLVPGIKDAGYNVTLEVDQDSEWDGEGTPTDIVLRLESELAVAS